MPTKEQGPFTPLLAEEEETAFARTGTGSSGADSRADVGPLVGNSEPRTGVWINVHADPHNGGNDGAAIEPAVTMVNLLGLLGSAKEWGHQLSVLLSPPWTDYLLADAGARQDLADRLTEGGHVLGFHHHDVTHTAGAGWDGYHSLGLSTCMAGDPDAPGDTGGHTLIECTGFAFASPLGFIVNPVSVEYAFSRFEDLMELLFSTNGVDPGPYTAGYAASHGTDASLREQEWQGGAKYSQSNATALPAPPTCERYNGTDVHELSSMHLAVGSQTGRNIEPEKLVADLVTADTDGTAIGDYFGTTIHAWEYRDTFVDDADIRENDDAKIDGLFTMLNFFGYSARLMQDVLDEEAPMMLCDLLFPTFP